MIRPTPKDMRNALYRQVVDPIHHKGYDPKAHLEAIKQYKSLLEHFKSFELSTELKEEVARWEVLVQFAELSAVKIAAAKARNAQSQWRKMKGPTMGGNQ